MARGSVRRRGAFAPALFMAVYLWLGGPLPAHALELFDGRIQAHGFLETQVRGISEGYGLDGEEMDLAMWYNILNVEFEFDILPDGYGPIDLLEAYVRVEARYDCIYTHGCGMFPSVDTFGNDHNRLPNRLRDADDPDYGGVLEVGEKVKRIQNKKAAKIRGVTEQEPFGEVQISSQVLPKLYRGGWTYSTIVDGTVPRCDPALGCPGEPGELVGLETNPLVVDAVVKRLGFPGFDTFYNNAGADLIPNTEDDPALYTNGKYSGYRFALKDIRGAAGGAGTTQIIGPWLPKNTIHPNAVLRDIAHPLRDRPTQIVYSATGMNNQRYNTRSTDIFSDRLAPILIADPGPPTTFTSLVDPFPADLLETWEADNYGTMPYDSKFVFTPQSSDPNQKFGGDYSGIIPCIKPTRNSTFAPDTSDMQKFLDGTAKRAGCIPFTNIRVTGGSGELPLRVAPDRSNRWEQFDPLLESQGVFDPRIAQGLYIPSPGLIRQFEDGDLDSTTFNISEHHRAWNRGASQKDNKEVKEAFVDIEWLDSRLWTRFGLQNIVWGKTELFRTTDQFNPQDFALQTIPGLEESRIALWAARFVYSLYNVGPLEDVRVEFAANLDDIEPNDLGACGEPYTFNIICSITTGIFAHSLLGIGVAGVDRPDDWTDDLGGLEIGGRMEWRWDRFSFALTDFYGYNDFPYPDAIHYFDRSVEVDLIGDPEDGIFAPGAGRPLAFGFSTGCSGEWGEDGERIWASANRDPKSYRSMTGSAAPKATTVFGSQTEFYNARGGAGIGRDPACLKPGGASGGLAQNGYTVVRNESTGEVRYAETDDFGVPLSNLGTNYLAPFIPIFCDPEVMLTNCEPLQYEVGLLEDTVNGELFADGWSPENALENHTANQQSFAYICSGTVTIGATLDPGACAFTLFGSPGLLDPGVVPVPFSEVLSCVLAGEIDTDCINFINTVSNNLQGNAPPRPAPLVPLNRDRSDGVITATHFFVNRCPAITTSGTPFPFCTTTTESILDGDPIFTSFFSTDLANREKFARFLPAPQDMLTLDSTLTNEQRALLGCGPYMGTRCDSAAGPDPQFFQQPTPFQPFVGFYLCTVLGTACNEGGGIDFLNMDASALMQSVVGVEGSDLRSSVYTSNPEHPEYAQWAAGGSNFVGTAFAGDGIWLSTSGLPQPGTIEFLGGPVCTRFVEELGDTVVLPGCRGANKIVNRETAESIDGFIMFEFDDGYDTDIDGCVLAQTIDGVEVRGRYADGSPVDLSSCFADSDHKYGRFYEIDSSGRVRLVASQTLPGSGTLWHPYAGCFANPADAVAGEDCVISPRFEADGVTPALQKCPASSACPPGVVDVGRDWESDFFNDDINTQSQIFRSELAAFSFNFATFLVQASCDKNEDDIPNDPECFNPNTPFAVGKCSWSTPQLCSNVKGFFGAAGVLRNRVRAGGSTEFGRRTFIWHSGGELVLKYQKRNVFGFSMDFGEDTTKSNWGAEFTWVTKQNFANNNEFSDGVTQSDVLNLTVSVDRPTFINFLNANRTFFINSQWFFQYITNYKDGFTANGPINVLFTVAVFTGYFQDRLNPQFVTVYDFGSKSGGLLPSVTYRFTESFSVGVGMSYFFGNTELRNMPVRGFAPAGNRGDPNAYKTGVDNVLSNFRDKDEVWMKLRWTF